MGLMFQPLPDLQGQFRALQTSLKEKTERIAELEQELREERMKGRGTVAAAEELRMTLGPLYHALQIIFGHIDEISPMGGAAPATVSDSKRQVWQSWQQKLGGLTAKAIDVLLLHGPMNQTQLRIQLSCANRSVTNIVAALNKAGLINKVDGKIALKEL